MTERDPICKETIYGNECFTFDTKGNPISHTIAPIKKKPVPNIPKIETSKPRKLPTGIGRAEKDVVVTLFKTEEGISIGNTIDWKLHISIQQLKAIPELASLLWKESKSIIIDEKYLKTINPPSGYILDWKTGIFTNKDGVPWNWRTMDRPLEYRELIELIRKRLEKIGPRTSIEDNLLKLEARINMA